MITSAFLIISLFLVNIVLKYFPSSDGLPDQVVNAFSVFGGYVGIFSPIFPIDTLYTIILLIFAVEVAIFGFKTLKWLVSHIPQIGGKGN